MHMVVGRCWPKDHRAIGNTGTRSLVGMLADVGLCFGFVEHFEAVRPRSPRCMEKSGRKGEEVSRKPCAGRRTDGDDGGLPSCECDVESHRRRAPGARRGYCCRIGIAPVCSIDRLAFSTRLAVSLVVTSFGFYSQQGNVTDKVVPPCDWVMG